MEYLRIEKDLDDRNVRPGSTHIFEIDLDSLVPLNYARRFRFFHIVYGMLTVGLEQNTEQMEFVLSHGSHDVYPSLSVSGATNRNVLFRDNIRVVTIPLDPHALYVSRDLNSQDPPLTIKFGITVFRDPVFWRKVELIYCFSNTRFGHPTNPDAPIIPLPGDG